MKKKKIPYKWRYSLLWEKNNNKEEAISKMIEIVEKLNGDKKIFVELIWINYDFFKSKIFENNFDKKNIYKARLPLEEAVNIFKHNESVVIYGNDWSAENDDSFINIKKNINFICEGKYRIIQEVEHTLIKEMIKSEYTEESISIILHLLNTKNKYTIDFNDWYDKNFVISSLEEIDEFIEDNNLKDFYDINKTEYSDYFNDEVWD